MSPLDDLFGAWLADALTPEAARELQELLRDPRERRRWRALADLEGALAEAGAEARGGPADVAPTTAPRRIPRSCGPAPRRVWPYALAAALLLALGGAGVLMPSPGADLPSQGGHRLARGETVAGKALLLWADGSRVELDGDASARVAESGKGVRLDHGRLVADIAPQRGEAFIVRSPQALVRVVGTRFSVVCEAEVTTLRVEHGRVAFTPLGGVEQFVTAGGDAVAGTSLPPAVLVGWWPLDESTGALAHDRSGQGHDGRIVGARWTAQGLRFAGGDDRVDIAATGVLDGLHAGDYSVAAWYRPERLPQRGDPVDPASTRDALSLVVGRSGWHLGLCLDHLGRFSMQTVFADHAGSYAGSQTIAEPGRWYHLAGVVDRSHGQTLLAVDGVVVTRQPWPPGTSAYDYPATSLWHIGCGEPGNPEFRWPSVGLIRDVRLYSQVLSAGEIRDLAGKR